MKALDYLRKFKIAVKNAVNLQVHSEAQLLLIGRLLSESTVNKKSIAALSDVEFKVFSQWGDDGIIQWLVNNLEFPNNTFVEFGVADYCESNTRFLMMNNWSGFVMDSSMFNVSQIVDSEYYWKYELSAKAAFREYQ